MEMIAVAFIDVIRASPRFNNQQSGTQNTTVRTCYIYNVEDSVQQTFIVHETDTHLISHSPKVRIMNIQ